MNGKRIVYRIGLVAAVVLAVGSAVGAGEKNPADSSDALRVGTFDTRAVALAYGRSEEFLASVRELKREAEEAERKGQQKRLEKLEAKGQALQEQLHRQVFGDAPIDGILAEMKDDLPEVARAAGVDVIVTGVLYAAPGAMTIDVTLQMVAPFNPDEQTLEYIEQLKTKPPVKLD